MAALRAAGRLLLETLREIFDENAYLRYLAREGAVPSRESYAAFLRENETARARRPRCC